VKSVLDEVCRSGVGLTVRGAKAVIENVRFCSKTDPAKGIPVIFAPGYANFMVSVLIDMAKTQFLRKRYHKNNHTLPSVRTEAGELRALTKHLGDLIKDAKRPVSFLVSLQGFSHHDSPEGHLHAPSL
jgi:uncharacterized protein (UPF0261 family)